MTKSLSVNSIDIWIYELLLTDGTQLVQCTYTIKTVINESIIRHAIGPSPDINNNY